MIDTDKYEGHTENWYVDWPMATDEGDVIIGAKSIGRFKQADAQLIAAAPLLLEFIQQIVEEWNMPNKCNQEFGKDVRQLMYEYGLITFNEETRRYEVRE